MSKHQQPMPVTRVRTTDHLGSLVRAARQASAADQQTAAGLLGVGTRFLGDVERGKPNVRLGLVLQVLAGLGLEVWIAPRGWRPREP
jgi:DNA-binding XRE family transcriptional regulator